MKYIQEVLFGTLLYTNDRNKTMFDEFSNKASNDGLSTPSDLDGWGVLFFSEWRICCFIFRTTMVKCNSDTEFLAKLHCIRIALEVNTVTKLAVVTGGGFLRHGL